MCAEMRIGNFMKIIHCADLHLDSNMTSNLTKDKAKERKAELLATFKKMITYAKENDIHNILIAGDLYDKKNISATARNVFISAVTDNPDITFYYLKGNHDAESLFIGMDNIPDNIKLFKTEWTSYELSPEDDKDDNRIVISGVELTIDNSDLIYNSLVLDNNCFNIVMLHGQESQTKSRHKYENISLRLLKNKGIDYLALGHIHSYKKDNLDSRGIYCYPGCLEGRGFDECGEHGFVVLDIEGNRLINHELIPIAKRCLYEVEVDISECMNSSEIINSIESVLDMKHYNSSSMIKVVLTGNIDVNCEKNVEYITLMFMDKYYYFKLYDHTGIRIDYDSFLKENSVKGEFVRLVKNDVTIDDDTKAAIIGIGINALSGEEYI